MEGQTPSLLLALQGSFVALCVRTRVWAGKATARPCCRGQAMGGRGEQGFAQGWGENVRAWVSQALGLPYRWE